MVDLALRRGSLAATVLLSFSALAGCSSNSDTPATDTGSLSTPHDGGADSSDGSSAHADAAVDAGVPSQCGHPGDLGNAIGVGKYCASVSDCSGLGANICSSLGNGATPSADDTYFCTKFPCHLDGGADECGENATCTCGSAQGMSACACTPNRCLTGTDGGTDAATEAAADGGTDANTEAATDSGADANTDGGE